MSSQFDFSSAWQDYKKRRLWFYVFWLGGWAVLFIIFLLLPLAPLDSIALFYILLGGQVCASFLASRRLNRFKCPRCHEEFFTTFWHNPFALSIPVENSPLYRSKNPHP